jgi:hypothetical protein
MSTRSQLRFVDSSIEWSDTVQVYRHSDGYPEGVLPDLRQLRDLQNRTGTERGPTYTAANFILLQKLRGMKMYVGDAPPIRTCIDIEDVLDPEKWDVDQPHFLLGYGVENPASGIHGDEEYLYIVDVGPDGWEVSVSEHNGFPSWDAADDLPVEETAFDHVEWQFDGISLDGAIDALVDE